MELLASCSLEQAKGFNGKLVIPNEDSKKPDKVFLNIEYDESVGTTSEFFKRVSTLDKNLIKCISFPHGYEGISVPEEWKGKSFVYTNLDEVVSNPNYTESDGVISLVKLSDDYQSKKYKPTLRDLTAVCEQHTNVRFTGGNLLAVEGLRIGRYDTGKDKMSPVYKDIYDTFVEVNLNDLDGLKEIVSKTRKKAEAGESGKKAKVRSKGTSKPKENRSSKRAEAAMRLFGGAEEEF